MSANSLKLSGNQDTFVDFGDTYPSVLLRSYETVTRSTPPRNGFRLSKMHMLSSTSLKLEEYLFPWKESVSLEAVLLKKTSARPIPSVASRLTKSPRLPTRVVRSLAFRVPGIVLLVAALYALHSMP
jgi:hypothetical protein